MSPAPPHPLFLADLATSRMRLRAQHRGDAPELFANYCGDAACSRFLQRDTHRDVLQTQQLLDTWCSGAPVGSPARFGWVLAEQASDEAVGLFLVILQSGNAQIHYGIAQRHWGKGLVAECGVAVTDWLLAQPTVRRVSTYCDRRHTASLRVLHKLGMREAGAHTDDATGTHYLDFERLR